MRDIFVCSDCLATYLPPADMRYASVGLDASPVQCAACQTAAGTLSAAQLPAEVLGRLLAVVGRGEPERQAARSVGPSRRRRQAGPGSARWRLG